MSYAQPLAPYDAYMTMLTTVGMTRGVVVQPTSYGIDCRALLDAIARAPTRMRGVAVANSKISDSGLGSMHAGGVRGLRFIEMPDPSGKGRYKNGVGTDELQVLAPRLRNLGWHAEIWAPCEYLAESAGRLARLGVPVVIDHMGLVDVAKGTSGSCFSQLLRLLIDRHIWIKLSICRVSRSSPEYQDVRPIHDALISANPNQLLWGSDWPHLGMGDLAPDVGRLVDLFGEWVGDKTLAHKILVENPAALYDF